MKVYLCFWLLLAAPVLFGQQRPIQWHVTSQFVSPNNFKLLISGMLAPGWHLYAQDDTATGLEGVKISWEDETIVEFEQKINSEISKTKYFSDPLFNFRRLKVYENELFIVKGFEIKGTVPSSFEITINAFASNEKEFFSIKENMQVDLAGQVKTTKNDAFLSSIDITHPVNKCGDEQTANNNHLTIFLLGVLGGLFALLTPCIFPMIPVTVSFFMNRSKSKREIVKSGLIYGGFILAIYVIASIPFHLIHGMNQNIFNSIATNAWLNLLFFIIFLLFSVSFFGLFDISLPSGLANSANSKSNFKSISGIFFMALTLTIVSFSCTGVILGVLLANVAASGPWALTAGMAGFGFALALPFAMFAIFPQFLKALPRSGNWLSTVKKILAFIELALAFKFLSNADLVQHWGILKRETFIGIWIAISITLILYLLGIFDKPEKLSGESILKSAGKIKLLTPKTFLALVFMAFTVYLVSGVTHAGHANLKLLSGFAPPLSYSIYDSYNIHGKGVEPTIINDYEKALELAKIQHKPVLIDFTGWACVNCRKMEEQVWTEHNVQQLINDNFILVSLYVDDRKKLPVSDQVAILNSNGEQKTMKTVGEKWAAFQAENFKQLTQPLYVVITPDQKLLNYPIGYTPQTKKYREWLQCGIDAFRRTYKN
jgi:thiol:disulfide interchange protein